MVLKCDTGVLKADWATHRMFEKIVDFPRKHYMLNLSSLDSGKRTQNGAMGKISNEKRR